MHSVLINPLSITDLQYLLESRNGNCVLSGSKSIEKDPLLWLFKTPQREDEKRFAITVDGVVAGCASLSDITAATAECSLFLDNESYTKRGVGTLALHQLLYYAKHKLQLNTVFAFVSIRCNAALKLYKRFNFTQVNSDLEGDGIRMDYCLADLKEAKVSVHMLVYNHEKFLSQALDSILSQKCGFSYNIVVGEDFSTDNSRNILLEYAERFPGKFKLILQPQNVGLFQNLKSVFEACDGAYVALCDGDDYWIDDSKLQQQVEFLESNLDYSVTAATAKIQQDTEVFENSVILEQNTSYNLEDVLDKSRFEAVTFVFRNRPRIILPDWFYEQGGEIDAMTLWLLRNGEKAYVFKTPMGVYRHHKDSLIRKTSAQAKVDFYLKMLENYNKSTSYKYDNLIKRKRLSILIQFNLYLLPYPKRVAFALSNSSQFFKGNASWKLLLKYIFPKNYN